MVYVVTLTLYFVICHVLVCIYGFGVISALDLSCLVFLGFKD